MHWIFSRPSGVLAGGTQGRPWRGYAAVFGGFLLQVVYSLLSKHGEKSEKIIKLFGKFRLLFWNHREVHSSVPLIPVHPECNENTPIRLNAKL